MLANWITLSRIFLGFGILAIFVAIDHFSGLVLWATLLLMTIAELTDIADGFVARWMGQETKLGRLLDPMADAFYRFFVFIGFASVGWIPVWICAIFFVNYIFTAYIRSFAASFGIGFDAAKWSGKIKSFLQGISQLLIVLFYILHNEQFIDMTTLVLVRDGLIAMAATVTILATLHYGYHFYSLASERMKDD